MNKWSSYKLKAYTFAQVNLMRRNEWTEQPTSIHDHAMGHPKDVVQDAPELGSVQADDCSPRGSSLPHQHTELPDKAVNLCFID